MVNDVASSTQTPEKSSVSQSSTDAGFKSPAPKATPKKKGAKATATLSK